MHRNDEHAHPGRYHSQRADQERLAAERTRDLRVRSIHQALAEQHERAALDPWSRNGSTGELIEIVGRNLREALAPL
jgi:hypothetical protein